MEKTEGEIHMTEAIAVAIITSGLSLIGVIATVIASNKKTAEAVQSAMKTAQAVTDTKLEQLSEEVTQLRADVRAHNEYGRKIPVLEEQIKVANHRIEDLERKVG